MKLFNLFRKRSLVSSHQARSFANRTLALESLESRSVLTAGALMVEPVELIGPVPGEAPAALIGPQAASASVGDSPLEPASGLIELDGATQATIATSLDEPEGEGQAPVITSFGAVELYGWVWFEGIVEDDAPVEGITVYFSGYYGEFTVQVESDGSFWSTPFMAEYGQVLAYAEDFDLNHSETVETMA